MKKISFLLASAAVFGMIAAGQSVSAKSYATVKTNEYMKTSGTTRNVLPTGSNALYTKAGTLKGAKLILTKLQMNNLKNSSSSKSYFRAYKIATTSRNSVYYKVVSFDGKYRGWVYGGSKTNQFGGGIKYANTTKKVDSSKLTGDYYFKNDPAAVTRNYPTMTQYKVKKIVTNPQKYLNVPLKVNKAAQRTKEGSIYYYVSSDKYPEVKGWIWRGYLTTKNDSSTDKNIVSFNALSSTDVVVKVKGLSSDKEYMARYVYSNQVKTANAYQYDANDKSASNQAKIKQALGDGTRLDLGDNLPTGVVKVSFDSQGKAIVTIVGDGTELPDSDYTLAGNRDAINSFNGSPKHLPIFSNATDQEVAQKLFGQSEAPIYYSYTDSNGKINKSLVTMEVKRDSDGNITNISINFA